MVTREGGRVKNCQFGSDVLFEWPLTVTPIPTARSSENNESAWAEDQQIRKVSDQISIKISNSENWRKIFKYHV